LLLINKFFSALFFYITQLKFHLRENQLGIDWQVWSKHINLCLASAFLVSIPVFFQAPLVRQAPWLSLILTVGWLGIAQVLIAAGNSNYQRYGSLIWGFSLSWLCGTAYWGWLRFEPLWHLPIEAVALPWAIWALRQDNYRIGAWFYLSSLLGTAVTDLYFYLNNLIPHWKAIMQLEGNLTAMQPILQDAVVHLQTPWGSSSAVILAVSISLVGFLAMRSPQFHKWTFAGALLSTIFVDGLFALFVCLS
jgi:hypothetical protein